MSDILNDTKKATFFCGFCEAPSDRASNENFDTTDFAYHISTWHFRKKVAAILIFQPNLNVSTNQHQALEKGINQYV